jgi:hypothetical protein
LIDDIEFVVKEVFGLVEEDGGSVLVDSEGLEDGDEVQDIVLGHFQEQVFTVEQHLVE